MSSTKLPRTFRIGSAALIVLLAGCSSAPAPRPVEDASRQDRPADRKLSWFVLDDPSLVREVALYSFGLINTRYQFGGRNPEAGLDCSGMVSFVVEQVSGRRLPHSAKQIAAMTRPIGRDELQAGDLVFFNTQNRSKSHMGIYVGEGRFIHAPSSKGSVRVEQLGKPYFAQRFDGAHTLRPAG